MFWIRQILNRSANSLDLFRLHHTTDPKQRYPAGGAERTQRGGPVGARRVGARRGEVRLGEARRGEARNGGERRRKASRAREERGKAVQRAIRPGDDFSFRPPQQRRQPSWTSPQKHEQRKPNLERTCRVQNPGIPRAGQGGAGRRSAAERGGAGWGGTECDGMALCWCAQETTDHLCLPEQRRQPSCIIVRRDKKQYLNRIVENWLTTDLISGLSAGP